MGSLGLIVGLVALAYLKELSEKTTGSSFSYPDLTKDPLVENTCHFMSFDIKRKFNTIELPVMSITGDGPVAYNIFVIPKYLDGQVVRSIITGKFTAQVYTGDYILCFTRVDNKWLLIDKCDCKGQIFKDKIEMVRFLWPGVI